MVFVGPVVLMAGALSACSSPLQSASGDSSSPTPSVSVTASETPSESVSTAPGSDSQQTGEPNPSPFQTPSRSTAPGAKPACAKVWVDGAVLPTGYNGCTGGPAADEQMLDCNSGPSLWIRNMADSSEYYAFEGKSINHTHDPDGDAAAQAKCMS